MLYAYKGSRKRAHCAEILLQIQQMAYTGHVLRGKSGTNAVLILEVKIRDVRA